MNQAGFEGAPIQVKLPAFNDLYRYSSITTYMNHFLLRTNFPHESSIAYSNCGPSHVVEKLS